MSPLKYFSFCQENLDKISAESILHYSFSSWTKKTMAKTIECRWDLRLCFAIARGCAEIFLKLEQS